MTSTKYKLHCLNEGEAGAVLDAVSILKLACYELSVVNGFGLEDEAYQESLAERIPEEQIPVVMDAIKAIFTGFDAMVNDEGYEPGEDEIDPEDELPPTGLHLDIEPDFSCILEFRNEPSMDDSSARGQSVIANLVSTMSNARASLIEG